MDPGGKDVPDGLIVANQERSAGRQDVWVVSFSSFSGSFPEYRLADKRRDQFQEIRPKT
jgi:hypothetical protein